MPKERHLDWSAHHTPGLATLNAAGGAAATSMVGSLADVPPTWALGAAGVGALGHAVATMGATAARRWHRTGCWAAAGGWVAWSIATTPWSVTSLASLACLSVAGYATARLVTATDQRSADRAHRIMLATRRARTGAEWEARLARVCGIAGARVVGVEQWETGTGYTLDVELPEGGKSWRDLATAAEALAADADLPAGCGVEVGPGVSRRLALIRVATTNVQAATLDYPTDLTPLTINNPIPIGLHRDGSDAGISLRQDTMLLTGQKGGGKTNQLQVINAGLVRCVDTLVWHIDLNGGGMSLPWIRPWWERDDVPRPAVDWVADTGREAAKMTAAALRIAKRRKVAHRRLMREAGDDKIPVSPDVPEIVIVVDECREVMGERTKHRQVADDLEEIQAIGRSVGVNIVFCGLRATTEVIGSTSILKQARARVSMSVQDPEELGYLFGWQCKASPGDIPYPGCGLYLQDASGNPRPFKGFRLVGDALENLAIAVAGSRPALDAASAEVAGPDYTGRWDWDRTSHLFDDGDDAEDVPLASAAAEPGGAATTSPLDQLDDAATVFAQPAPLVAGGGEVDWSDPSAWPSITVPTTAPVEVAGLPRLISRLLEVMGTADRAHTATLAGDLDMEPDKLGGLLRAVDVRPLPHAFSVRGETRRGYARVDLEAVAERIRAGQVEVPAEVAEWGRE